MASNDVQSEELRAQIENVFSSYKNRKNGVDLNTANYIDGQGIRKYVDAIGQLISTHTQQAVREARRISMGDFHELLMSYGKVCEEKGILSERAVSIRMDFATYYNEQQLDRIQSLNEDKETK